MEALRRQVPSHAIGIHGKVKAETVVTMIENGQLEIGRPPGGPAPGPGQEPDDPALALAAALALALGCGDQQPAPEPAEDKVYRHPTFYDIPDDVGHM